MKEKEDEEEELLLRFEEQEEEVEEDEEQEGASATQYKPGTKTRRGQLVGVNRDLTAIRRQSLLDATMPSNFA